MHSNFSSDLIEVLCIADTINFEDIERRFAKTFIASRFRDALHFDLPKGHVFIFNYGVVVAWGVSEAKKAQLMKELSHFTSEDVSQDWETYRFVLQTETAFTIANDLFTLPSAKTHNLLAVSHALAQSRKLELFETQAQRTIDNSRDLTKGLSKDGVIPVSRKQLAKLCGQMFQAKSDIILRFNILDEPEYFCDYPATQDDYLVTTRYLGLPQRLHLLNQKLQTIEQLFNMYAAEQNHKHWSFLGWLLIILIAVEIGLFFAQ